MMKDYFPKYIFPIILFVLLGIFLTFMQTRASSDDVLRENARLNALIASNAVAIQRNVESISKLSNEVSRVIGYVDAKKEHK